MSNYKTIKFKVLSDNCSAEDYLEDRTHERIADKLYEIISAESSEGMTVGLEGEWGAGKSTVIRLLQEKLKVERQYKTFVFYIDAWEHEGDHLRRVFLEMLIARLQKWSQTKKYFRALKTINDKVTAKSSTKFITHRARLSCFGKMLAFSTVFVPFGSVVVSKLFNEVTIDPRGSFHRGFCLGLTMLFAPLIVYILEAIRWFVSTGISWLHGKTPSVDGWAVFDSKARVDRVKETSLSDERSSVEFSKYFDEIMNEVKDEIDKIVIIVDNLDRIDQKDANRVWSTLQAFVQNKNPISYKTNKLCKWIIVPYAQEGLEKVWQNGSGGQENSNESKNRPLSFMDKSFQLRLHVPKMVISGWRSFAGKCLKDAAGELDHDDVAKILNVLSWTRKNLTDAPSPRQIKIYINQVGLACSLYGERVPLEAICFYVVKKYLDGLSDNQLEDELRGGEISATSLPQYENCHELASEVAAILYGVEQDKAMQILLEPIISDCLNNSRSEEIRVIEEMHGIVFYDVLDYVLKQTEKSFIPKYVASIQRAFPESKERAYSSALNALRLNEGVVFEKMHEIVHKDAIAIIELANIDTNKDLVKKIANAYALELPKRFRLDGGAMATVNKKVEYIESTSAFVKCFSDVSFVLKEPVKIPYKSFKDAGVDFSKFSSKELNGLAAHMSEMDIADEDITEYIQEGKPILEWVANFISALTSNGLKKIDKIIGAINRAFAWNNGRPANGVYASPHWDILLAAELIDEKSRPIDSIKSLILSKGFWYFNKFPNSQTLFLLAKYHGELTNQELAPNGFQSTMVNQYRNAWNNRDYKKGLAIYQYISYSHDFNWLAIESAKPKRALVGSIVEAAIDAKDQYLFDVERPFEFLAYSLRLVDESHREMLVDNFTSCKDRLRGIAELNVEKLLDYPQACYELISLIIDGDYYNQIVQKIKSELVDLTNEKWSEAFKSSNWLAKLVALLVSKGENLKLEISYYEAFKGFICERIKNNIDCGLLTDKFEWMYKAMKQSLQKVFAGDVGNVLVEMKFKIASNNIKEFVLNVPDYEEWLEEKRVSVKNISVDLSDNQFDNFITIIQRCGASLSNKAEIKDVVESVVLEKLKHKDIKIKEIGEKAALYFGINLSVDTLNEENKMKI